MLAVAALLLLSPALAAAAESDAVDAAVAPAQTSVDAASRIVHLAIEEASRDATPDEAMALRDDLVAFARAFDRSWSLPDAATHKDLALAALPFGTRVALAVGRLPEDVALLATLSERCARDLLERGEYAARLAAFANATSAAASLAAIASSAPEGVRALGLEGAARRLAGWSLQFEGLPGCGVAGDAPVSFLLLDVSPSPAWPTATLVVRGTTNDEGPVSLAVPGLEIDGRAWSVQANVTDDRFLAAVLLPRTVPLGEHVLTASGARANASTTFTIARAPSSLAAIAPASARVGENVTVLVSLESPVPEDTLGAVVDGPGGARIRLAGGRAFASVPVGTSPGLVSLRFSFAGTDVVAPSEASAVVNVVAPGAVAPAPAGPPARPVERAEAPFPIAALVVGLLALTVLLGAAWVQARRRRVQAARPASPSRRAGVARDDALSSAALDPSSARLVALFSAVARALRAAGLARASTTAREMRPALERLGAPAEAIVESFERARYAGEPEREDWRDRARAWFRVAWAKLAGASP